MMKFRPNIQETIDTYKNDWSIEKVERGILHDYFRVMSGFGTILDLDFDLDKSFEYECRLDGNYLCTISHDEDDRITKKQMSGFQAYRLVVTWPRDGRKEYWTLELMVWSSGEFREYPRGRKSVSSLLYDDKMVIQTRPMVNDLSPTKHSAAYICMLLRRMEMLNSESENSFESRGVCSVAF
jgi:hypothetical protein